jgi:hypothetical protein
MNPILGILASSNFQRANPSYESIATTTVGGGGSATITFSSIPATYTHLQLRYICQDNRGTYNDSLMNIRFNSDTGNNYAWHYVRGNGSATESSGTTSTAQIQVTTTASSATSKFVAGVLDVLDYRNTNKYKTARLLTGFDTNNTGTGSVGLIYLNSGLWQNTNAITTITFASALGTQFNQYSSFALYGIKGA